MNYRQFRYFFTFLRNRKIRNPNVYIPTLHNSRLLGRGREHRRIRWNTRHGARTTGKLTGPSTVVAAYDQINGREKERERGGREGEREYLWYANSKRTNED